MAKTRIKRRIVINGVVQWVTGNSEQEYAENLFKAMGGAGNARQTPQEAVRHDFTDYARNWFEVFSKPNIDRVTAITYERQLRNTIFPAFAGMCVEDITAADVQRMFNAMDNEAEKKAKATKDKAKCVLNMVFEQAIEDNIIHKNPLASRSVRVKGAASNATPPYTVAQMRHIAANISRIDKPFDRNYIALQAFHPFRLEEVLGLRWQDIDLENNLIHIRNTVTHPNRNQGFFAEKTKTDASRRTIALVAQIKEHLTVGSPDDFVVGGKSLISYQQLRRICERIQKDIDFDERITPRRFRTTVLTDLYDVTKDIKQAQAAAGHTTAAMTLKHYVQGRACQMHNAEPIAHIYGLSDTAM